MTVAFNLATAIDAALKQAAVAAGMDAHAFSPDVRPADSRHGDYQANGVLAYAKSRKLNPRATAEQLLTALPADIRTGFDTAIAGPGFINFTAKPGLLQSWLLTYSNQGALSEGAAVTSGKKGQTWIVDYSSPNTAKQMHVGHLRSAVIGESICRLLAFGGASVVRDNHIGDWGTQFGKLIWAYKRHLDAAALEREPLEEFERLYKLGNNASDADPAVLEEARQELVKLQAGDAENLAIWKRINDVSLAAFQVIYDQLGITFDVALGESFYNDKVEAIYKALTDCGLAELSQGALVVFHPEHPRFKTQPFIIRKSDGAANYASTDLATIRYRTEQFHASGVLYVVDKRQSDHFEQLIITARKWYEKEGRPLPYLEHLDFGTVLGENGKPLKTRSGDNIRLKDLLGEAVERARRLVDEKSAELSEQERAQIASIVGIGSVQYADLSQNRSTDYVFAWDKMISLDGNTAAYLLYAIARIHSIFRKLGIKPGDDESKASALETPTEIALARRLVKFADAVQLSTAQLRPHFLSMYLYELAGEFSAFYTADKVAVEDAAIRNRRLLLCARTLLVLETGVGLLGLRTLQRM
ncbi:MAG: arginine--tRNA ligase [Opitutaceae bacterium]